MAPTPLGLGRLEASDAEQRVPQQASAPQLRTTHTHTHEDRQRAAYHQYVCVCVYLYRDVCVGVSPVEDGSEVELGVSLLSEHSRPDGVALTSHYGVNIWSCNTTSGGVMMRREKQTANTCLQTLTHFFPHHDEANNVQCVMSNQICIDTVLIDRAVSRLTGVFGGAEP